MLGNIRLLLVFSLLLTAVVTTQADEPKSFSKQMNEIKRSGNYVYAEASAQNEADAKASCDALLNIEITKYLASIGSSQAGGRIGNKLADCNIEYLVQMRGDLVRVFGYVAKSSISPSTSDKKPQPAKATNEEKQKVTTPPSAAKKAEETKVESPADALAKTVTTKVATTKADATEAAASESPVAAPASHSSVDPLKSEGLELAKWQLDMLETIAKQSDMIKAKRLLNRYKNQYRIKRLGDKSISNPRPTDTFYIIFDNNNKLIALLAPSPTANHYDMVSGTTVSLDSYSDNPHYWFQISQ